MHGSVKSQKPQDELLNDVLSYNKKHVKEFTVKADIMSSWEAAARENLNILSYLDFYTTASQTLFVELYKLMEKCEDEEELDKAWLWNVARKGVCMNHNGGLGLQDLVKNTVALLGETTVARRDGYLDRFGDRVPECNIMSLRKSTLSSLYLFEPEVLREAIEAAKAKRDGKCQNRLINQVTSLAKASTGKPRYDKQPIRTDKNTNRGQSNNSNYNRNAGNASVKKDTGNKKNFRFTKSKF